MDAKDMSELDYIVTRDARVITLLMQKAFPTFLICAT